MNINKYDGRGIKKRVALTVAEKAEFLIKAFWYKKIKPLNWAMWENIFYGLIFFAMFAVLCFAAGYIFYLSNQYPASVRVMSLMNQKLMWVFPFIIGYLFKITTSGNWFNIAYAVFARLMSKAIKPVAKYFARLKNKAIKTVAKKTNNNENGNGVSDE
ncbi:hypothetical protein [Pseudomonas sp. HY7a-MNA-CIBAN-0227]|uniref:hypothetical protein n=1 Tax=Pseudomonas sp. HY7a-MNA-CIBAN-0227 TaxID=3140474 RepID=UPI00331E59A8